jgi:hypothetical protein
VERIDVTCEFNSHYSALFTLLQDLTNILKHVVVSTRTDNNVDGPDSLDGHEMVREVTSVLTNNTKLIGLRLKWWREQMSDIAYDYFKKLICDQSSIESIYNSNHTLEELILGDSCALWIYELSRLNNNKDKAQVVRNKILKYYFVGDFDVMPFTNMPVSVVPEVICRIRSDTKQSLQSAIFRLLKCIPELSNMGNRSLLSTQAGKMKRQKIEEKV